MTEEEEVRVRKAAMAEGWGEAVEAIFWCRENSSGNWADAIDYVAKNNPYKENHD